MHGMHLILASRHSAGQYATVSDFSCLVASLCTNHNAGFTIFCWKRPLADLPHTRWRYQMETFSALLALCEGNPPVTGEFPKQRPVTRSFDALFDLCLNKRLSKQSWGWWFEMPSRPLWRHCDELRYVSGNMHIILLLYGHVILNTFLELCNSLCKMLLRRTQRMFLHICVRSSMHTSRNPIGVTNSCICKL